jgi:hypothetical protein
MYTHRNTTQQQLTNKKQWTQPCSMAAKYTMNTTKELNTISPLHAAAGPNSSKTAQ